MNPTQNSFAMTERVTTSLEATSEERQASNLHSLTQISNADRASRSGLLIT